MGKSSIKSSRVPGVFDNMCLILNTHIHSILPRNLEHDTKQTGIYRYISLKEGISLVPGYTMHPGTTPELFRQTHHNEGGNVKKVNVFSLNVPGKNELFSLLVLVKTGYTRLNRDLSRSVWLMCSGVKGHFPHLLKNINGGCYDFHY